MSEFPVGHSPCSSHERRDAPRGAGFISVSRLHKDQRYESRTQELIGPTCEMTASKLKYFNSGRKLRRCKRVAHITSTQTRRLEKYRVYHSHTHLYVDFSVARKNSFAFGVNVRPQVAISIFSGSLVSLYTHSLPLLPFIRPPFTLQIQNIISQKRKEKKIFFSKETLPHE